MLWTHRFSCANQLSAIAWLWRASACSTSPLVNRITALWAGSPIMVQARLAGFETPKRVVFVERYPETVGGKVLKHVLRAELGRG